MAPAALQAAKALLTRQYGCPSGTYYSRGRCYTNSNWNRYGRWIFLGVIIVFFLLVFFMLSCINARRRRSRALRPYYGTGWLAGKPQTGHYGGYSNTVPQQQQGGYYANPQYAQPAPPYAPPANQGSNADYYGGGQQSGIELQQPQSSYQPNRAVDGEYQPPAGPPPGKY